jgi:hypothetical protein
MVVRLRLQRLGLKALPFYRIVVADSRSKRDGKHIENLGTYVNSGFCQLRPHYLTFICNLCPAGTILCPTAARRSTLS